MYAGSATHAAVAALTTAIPSGAPFSSIAIPSGASWGSGSFGGRKPPIEGAEAGAASASVPPSQAGPIGSSNSCGRTAGCQVPPVAVRSPVGFPARNRSRPVIRHATAQAQLLSTLALALLPFRVPLLHHQVLARLRGAGLKPSRPEGCVVCYSTPPIFIEARSVLQAAVNGGYEPMTKFSTCTITVVRCFFEKG